MSIYHWKLGDIALAKVCQKVYAKVQVVKNEEGLFYDEKVLGISSNEDGSINVTHQLCYHVEIVRTNQRLWLPYTSLHLAERSRPFYGTDKASPNKIKSSKTAPDQSDSFSEIKGFVQIGKDVFFDDLYSLLVREDEITERHENDEIGTKENKDSNAMEMKKRNIEINVEENMEYNAKEYTEENQENSKEIYTEEGSKKDVEEEKKESDSKKNNEKNLDKNKERNVNESKKKVEKCADRNKTIAEENEEIKGINTQGDTLKEVEKNKNKYSVEYTECHAEDKCNLEVNKDRLTKESISETTDKIKDMSANRRKEILDYLKQPEITLEDKFQTVLELGKVTEKDLDNYYNNCWRYLGMVEEDRRLEIELDKQMHKDMDSENEGGSELDYDSDDLEEDEHDSDTSPEDNYEDFLLEPPPKPSVHAWWCLVCGKEGGLIECPRCPSSYHEACKGKWLVTVFHRMKQAEPQLSEPDTCMQSSSTAEVKDPKEDIEKKHCPSCTWGPKIGCNDIVWNKYGSCPWWPARVLPRQEIPDWLMERAHSRGLIPLRYYGTQEHAWTTLGRTCLFLPKHADGRVDKLADESGLGKACLEACDHYVALYLT